MMRKLIVLLAVAMVFGCVGGAYADATQWLIYLKATDANGAGGLQTTYNFGLRTGADDAIDTMDATNGAGTGAAVCIGAFDNGAGSGNGYYKDFRAPGTTNLTWNLKLWVQSNFTATSTVKLTGWNPTGTYDMASPLVPSMKVTAGANSFVFDGSQNGSSTQPLFTWTFDAASIKGLPDNGIDVVIAPVPEPGSMLALASGLVGLVGFGIRRRK